jgi:hypothetical protein
MTRQSPVTGAGTRRRVLLLLSGVAAASLAVVGLAPAPSHAQATVCTGALTGISIGGDIEVPAGEACTLTNVVVPGSAVVGAGADLFLIDSHVSGTVAVQSSGFVQATRSTLSSRVSLVDAFGMLAEESGLSAGVGVDGGLFFSTGSTLSGSVNSSDGWTFIEAGQVSGDVVTVEDQATDLSDVSMSGLFRVTAASTGSVICRSIISGRIEVIGSGGVIQLGGDQPAPDCGSNVVNGEILLDGNDASDIVVAGNMVFGNLICVDNAPAPSGSGNQVSGNATGQCAGFGSAGVQQVPAAAPAGTESLQQRRQAILHALSERAIVG